MLESHLIRHLKEKAYSGNRGARRKTFCQDYQQTLRRVRAKAEKQFAASLAVSGEKLSCARGCDLCCFQHISTPAAHCIAVVDFLYENTPAMTSFLTNYKIWNKTAGILAEEIDAAYNRAIDAEQTKTQGAKGLALSRAYYKLRIPCPFLENSACLIYEVRPICCSSHRAVTPSEWCAPESNREVRTFEVMPEGKDLQKLVDLAPLPLTLFHATLPAMVYRMLTRDLLEIFLEIDNWFPGLPTSAL